jgi:NADPH-dependent curcumin reductase
VQNGTLKYRETIAEGLASAPQAFITMLTGGNFGKQLVRVGPDPA